MRRYANSPIIEALCEFQFAPDSPWDLATPGLVYGKVQDTFPKRRQATRVTVAISASPGVTGQQLETVALMQFLHEDEKALIQVGPNLLAVNHLKP